VKASAGFIGVKWEWRQLNLLHAGNKVFIVFPMTATLVFSALFLALTGALIARLSLRAKLLPLLRRAR
jgi:cytochrome bd-type quinol oxidase subunit 2